MLLHKDGGWHIRQAGGATSQSIVTWPLRGQSITGKPWLLSPASSQRRWGSGNRFLYGCGPAQVGFGLHWKASPFLLRLGRQRYGSRALSGRERYEWPGTQGVALG